MDYRCPEIIYQRECVKSGNCNHSEELQASWHLSSRRGKEGGEASRTTLRYTSRGEDFKLSLAARTRERAGTGRPTTRRVRVVGCQLIWRLYVYYDTRGTNTSSSLLANRSEKSAKPSRPSRAARLAGVHKRKSGKACSCSLFERETVSPFFRFFYFFYSTTFVTCV